MRRLVCHLRLLVGDVVFCGSRNGQISNGVECSLHMRATSFWLVILDVYTYEESGEHETTPPTSSKGACLEMAELSFCKVSILVAILTSTSSEGVQSLVLLIVQRFSLTLVFLEVYWSSVPLHGQQHYTSSCSSCCRVVRRLRIFIAWIVPQGSQT